MLSCWRVRPDSRPLFDSLEKSFYNLLEEGVAQYYIDLNNPYLQANISFFKSGNVDYLAMMDPMGPPDYQAPPCPPSALNFDANERAQQTLNTSMSRFDCIEMDTLDSHGTENVEFDTHENSHHQPSATESLTPLTPPDDSELLPMMKNGKSNSSEEISKLRRPECTSDSHRFATL